MDDIVLQAMARWPDVPSVYGWVSLDRRGRWRIKGEIISNPHFSSYIGRNYARDVMGCWYFQNGPQRVYVQLAYLPAVVHFELGTDTQTLVVTHAGLPFQSIEHVWLDETGSVLLQQSGIVALVLDRDLARTLDLLEDSHGARASTDQIEDFLCGRGELYFRYRESLQPLRRIHSLDAPRLFGFVTDPRPALGEPEC